MYRLWDMLLVTTVVVLVTSAWSLIVMAANMGKVIYWSEPNTCLEDIAPLRRHNLEGCGFKYLRW